MKDSLTIAEAARVARLMREEKARSKQLANEARANRHKPAFAYIPTGYKHQVSAPGFNHF